MVGMRARNSSARGLRARQARAMRRPKAPVSGRVVTLAPAVMPPVTAVFGLAWFGESLTPAKVAGFALSAAGVWLATREASAVPARR